MAYANGRIPLSALSPIEDGLFLESRAARAWIACRPVIFKETGVDPDVTNPDGAYRDMAGQIRQKQFAIRDGQPRRAATPGYSSHGMGISIDLYNISKFNLKQLEGIMARFGFHRNIPFESWHFTHDGRTIPAAVVAASEVIAIPEEDEMSAEDSARLKRIESVLGSTHAGIWYGGTSGGKNLPGVLPILIENQRRINIANASLTAQRELLVALAAGALSPVALASFNAQVEKLAGAVAGLDELPTLEEITAAVQVTPEQLDLIAARLELDPTAFAKAIDEAITAIPVVAKK